MPNEFIARNGVIAQNNSQITGSLTVSNGITGSFFGTASFALSASCAISALTASYIETAQTASYVLQAVSSSYAQTASLALAVTGGFAKSFAIINNTGIVATDVGTFPVWRCNVACTASQVLGYTDSGSAVLVNATKNGSGLLASNLSISTDTWVSSSILQNQNFNVGDILAFKLVSFSGTPKEITIQASLNY